jgi:tetratricopeptide (TPR) repeat protein
MTDETQIKYLERADYLIEINRWREAIVEITRYLSAFPDDYNALCQIAFCHYELNELKPALKFTKNAIVADPELEWAYRIQSLIFGASGNNSKALKMAEICVEKAPHFTASLQTLAYAQVNKFLLDDAKNTSDIMLEIAPEATETHDACGYLAMKNEDWATAEKHFKLSLQIESLSYFTLNNLGNVYFHRSKIGWNFPKRTQLHRQAVECFAQSVKINPTFKLAQENLKIAKETGVIFRLPISKILINLLRSVLFLGVSFYAMYAYIQYFGITPISWLVFVVGYLFLILGISSFINHRRNKNM